MASRFDGLMKHSLCRRIVLLILLGGVTALSVHAAPPPPRGGSRPHMNPSQRTAQPPAGQSFTATPLKQLIEQHEKNQQFNAKSLHALDVDQMKVVLRDDYLAHGSRNEKWDEPLLKAIDETLRCLDISAQEPQRKNLMHLLRMPARFKCDDPRYYYMYAYARNYNALQDSIDALEKGIELAKAKPEHHRHLLWLMGLRLSQMQNRWESKEEMAIASRHQARGFFVDWLEHDMPRFNANLIYDWSDYFEELTTPVKFNEQEEASIQEMMDRIAKIEHLEPWVQAVLQAKAAMRWAWAARGTGYADTVTDEGWMVWQKKNAFAYQKAIEAHRLNPRQALAATLLIELCWAADESQGPEYSSRYWLEQAVAAMIDYQPAYTSYVWGILPRWGGSTEMMFDFAWECASTNHYQTDVPYFGLLTAHTIRGDLTRRETPLEPQRARQLNAVLQHVMTGYLQHEKDPGTRQLLQQFWLNWTHKLDLPDQALRVHDQLDVPYDSSLPQNKKYFYMNLSQYDLNVFLARAQPGGNVLTLAIQAEKNQDWLDARRLYESIITSNELGQHAVQFARDRIQHHQWQEAFNTEQWVALQFDEQLTGWKPLAGQWERIDENTIKGINNELPMRITPIIDLGKHYEWEMTLHFVHKAKGPALMAGLVYAYENHPEHYGQYGQFFRQQPGSTWYHYGGYEPYRSGNIELPETFTCKFVVQNGQCALYVDGKEVQKPYWTMRKNWYISLSMGTAFTRNPGSIVHYSHIRVRKLPEPRQAQEDVKDQDQDQEQDAD